MHAPFQGIKYLFSKELSEIYIAMAIRRFAIAMIGIFIPLYLFVQLGLPLGQVLLYHLMECITFLFTGFFGAWLGTKIGAKHLMLWSMPFLIIGFLLLNLLEFYPVPYYLPALFIGFHYGLFWMGMHVEFVSASDRDHRGRTIAVWHSVAIIAGMIGPLVGGLILTFSTFFVLLIVTSVGLLVSVIPYFFSKDVKIKYKFSWESFFDRSHYKYGVIYITQAIRWTGVIVIWPIFVFSILGGYLSLGIMGTLSSFGMAIFSIVLGKIIDKSEKFKIAKIGALFSTFTMFLRQFVQNTFQIFAIDFLGSLSFSAVDMPILAKTYNKANRENLVGMILFRETFLRFGRLIALAFLFLMLYLLPDVNMVFKSIFTFSAIVGLAQFLI